MISIAFPDVFGLIACSVLALAPAPPIAPADGTPLTPAMVQDTMFEGKATLEFAVDKAGQLIEGRSIQPDESEALYLSPAVDERKASRVYVILSWKVATRLKHLGIDDPASHFRGKMLRVSGSVVRLSGGDVRARRVLSASGSSETVLGGTVPEYVLFVESLDQLKVVRKRHYYSSDLGFTR